MALSGVKNNKCFLPGVQGVCNTITAENDSGQPQISTFDYPANNTLYILKEWYGVSIYSMPENPTADFNFKITMQKTTSFFGVVDAWFMFWYGSDTANLTRVTIKWDNPNIDITTFTVLHVHVWYDGINYCAHVDGY